VPAYGVGDQRPRRCVTIFANSGSLFVSTLRALPGATDVHRLWHGDHPARARTKSSAFVNVSFSNLSSPEVVAHLAIDGDYVLNLPQGQVSNARVDPRRRRHLLLRRPDRRDQSRTRQRQHRHRSVSPPANSAAASSAAAAPPCSILPAAPPALDL
jgi:hypothetical protein